MSARVPDAGAEVVLLGAEARLCAPAVPRAVRWIVAPSGRAGQLNAEARVTRGRGRWCLHADSRLDARSVDALARALGTSGKAVHEFDLAFLPGGPRLMRLSARSALSALGAWVGSRWGGMPFVALPHAVWTEEPHSEADTFAALAPRLRARGMLVILPPAFDVDTMGELARLGGVLTAHEGALLAEQRTLFAWLVAGGLTTMGGAT